MKPRKIFGWLILLFQVILILKLVEYAQGDTRQSTASSFKFGTVFPVYMKRAHSKFQEENRYHREKEGRPSPIMELYHILTGQEDYVFQESQRQTTTKTTYVPVVQIATGAAMAVIWYFIFIRVWKDPVIADFGQTSLAPSPQTTTLEMQPTGPPAQSDIWNSKDSYSIGRVNPGSDAYSQLTYGQEKYGG